MADDEYGLVFNLDDNIGDVLGRLSDMEKSLDQIEKGLIKVGKASKDEVLGSIGKVEKSMSSLVDLTGQAATDSAFGHNFESAAKGVEKIASNMAKLRNLQSDMIEAEHAGNQDLAKQKQAQFKDTLSMIETEKKAMLSAIDAQSKRVKKVFIEDKKEVDKILTQEIPKDVGRGVGNAIKSVLQGDVAGLVGGLTEGAGSAARFGGGKLRNISDQRALKKEMATGIPGGTKGMGQVTKALGGIARFLGPLAVAVGGIGAIVKLLIDAEAQTKELNKALMDQVPYFVLAKDGFGAAEERLKEMREVATDFATNVRLGMDPKMHYEVITALEEHGGNLHSLEQEYDSFGAMAKDVIETVRVSSLNMGTSLGETAQFVGELRDLHAKSMGEIKSDLTLVTGLSREAGISTKKFFGTITQLSGQMGLYNYKLEDAAFLLTEMNKIMDSKSAEAFTTKMVTGLKDMNAQTRMQTMFLAGQGKVRKMVIAASKKMFQKLEGDAGAFTLVFNEMFEGKYGPISSMEELEKKIQKMNADEKNRLIAVVQNELGEEASRQLSQAIRLGEKARRGGLSIVDAMSDLGALDSMEIQIAALENVFGSIEKVPDIMAEQLNLDQDQLRQMQRFSEVAKGNYSVFQHQLSVMKKANMSDEEIAGKIKQLSDQFGYAVQYNEETKTLTDKNGNVIKDQYDLLGSMKDEQKKKIEESAASQMSAAERQIVATQSVADILKYLVADLLNTIGNQLTGINSLMLDWFGKGTARDKEEMRLQNEMASARSDVFRLEKKRKKAMGAGDQKAVSAIDAQLAEARARMESVEAEQDYLDKNRGDLFTKSGQKKSSYGLTMASRKKADKMGFTGTTEEFMALQRAAQTQAASLGTVTAGGAGGNVYSIGGKEVTAEELDKARAAEAERLLEENINNRKLAESQKELQEEIFAAQEENAKKGINLSQTTNQILEKKGIKLSPDALTGFQMAMIEAYNQQAMIEGLTNAGFTRAQATGISSELMSGGVIPDEARLRDTYGVKRVNAKMKDALNKAYGGEFQPTPVKSLTPTQDAKILSGGFAPLSFSPGDLVIKSNALARTQTGGAGSMLKNLTGSGGSGTSNFNINITVNNPQRGDVQEEILRTVEMLERKKSGG